MHPLERTLCLENYHTLGFALSRALDPISPALALSHICQQRRDDMGSCSLWSGAGRSETNLR